MLGQLFRRDNGPSSRVCRSTGHKNILGTSHPVSRSRCHPNGPVRLVWRRYRLRLVPVALGRRLATLSARLRRSSACGPAGRRTRAVSDRSLGWSVRGFGRETTGNATHRAEPRRRRIGSTICRAPPVRFRSARSGRARIPAKSHFSARSERKIETRQRSFPSAVADVRWAVPADRAGRTAKQGADEPYARSDSSPRRCSGWSS
jgi:hypothetical protein